MAEAANRLLRLLTPLLLLLTLLRLRLLTLPRLRLLTLLLLRLNRRSSNRLLLLLMRSGRTGFGPSGCV